MKRRMNMECGKMIIYRGYPKYSKNNLFQRQIVDDNSQMDYLGFNPCLRSEKPATYSLRSGTS